MRPCRTSIPHLAELQAKLGGKRFQVVGIACEKGAIAPGPAGQRGQGDPGSGDQLSRAPFEQGRIVPGAASASDPVLPDDGLA